MSKSKNIAIIHNGFTVDSKGTYTLSQVLAICGISRPCLSYWIDKGRIDPPVYPFGRTTTKTGKLCTRDYHFWTGATIIKAIRGNWTPEQEQGAESEDR